MTLWLQSTHARLGTAPTTVTYVHREFENYPEGEKAEMIDLYQEKGYTREDATKLVEILTRNKETFINTMMVEGI